MRRPPGRPAATGRRRSPTTARAFSSTTRRAKRGAVVRGGCHALEATGPYTDHGPLVCQDAGSIDGGRHGREWTAVSYLEGRREQSEAADADLGPAADGQWDGAQRRTARNPAQRRRLGRHLIEGHSSCANGWFYLFYSAGACCGRSCDYRLGVARARAFSGLGAQFGQSWTSAIEHWKCPGHGSLVTRPDGRTFLLYHAYHPTGLRAAGRQALLDEVTWKDEWPVINGGRGPSAQPSASSAAKPDRQRTLVDAFDSSRLDPQWQWPWDHPKRSIARGVLRLQAVGRDPANPADTIV